MVEFGLNGLDLGIRDLACCLLLFVGFYFCTETALLLVTLRFSMSSSRLLYKGREERTALLDRELFWYADSLSLPLSSLSDGEDSKGTKRLVVVGPWLSSAFANELADSWLICFCASVSGLLC